MLLVVPSSAFSMLLSPGCSCSEVPPRNKKNPRELEEQVEEEGLKKRNHCSSKSVPVPVSLSSNSPPKNKRARKESSSQDLKPREVAATTMVRILSLVYG